MNHIDRHPATAPGPGPELETSGEDQVTQPPPEATLPDVQDEPAAEIASIPATERAPLGPDEFLDTYLTDAIKGNPQATDTLMREVHARALAYCRRRLTGKDMYTAQDAAQETAMAVFVALPNYIERPSTSFWAFVNSIASHKVTDVYRATNRSRLVLTDEFPDAVDNGPTPEGSLEQHELARHLGQLLRNTVTPHQQAIIYLRKGVGLSAEETAEIVGSTTGAVRVSHHRAKERLRKAFPGSYFDDSV